jgi:hypothetical protein
MDIQLTKSSMSEIQCVQRRILYKWTQNKDVMNTELVTHKLLYTYIFSKQIIFQFFIYLFTAFFTIYSRYSKRVILIFQWYELMFQWYIFYLYIIFLQYIQDTYFSDIFFIYLLLFNNLLKILKESNFNISVIYELIFQWYIFLFIHYFFAIYSRYLKRVILIFQWYMS